MPRRTFKGRLHDLTVRAEDCYDPADYVMVHKAYLARLQEAAGQAVAAGAKDESTLEHETDRFDAQFPES